MANIFDEQEYKNYHLRLKFKWNKHDVNTVSGILYHNKGDQNGLLCHKLLLTNSQFGSYLSIGKAQISVRAMLNNHVLEFNPNAKIIALGEDTGNGIFCSAKNEEITEEWNNIELVCFQDKCLHIINNRIVMAISNSRFVDKLGNSKPLFNGKIQLKSEDNKVVFKNIEINQVNQLPPEYEKYFYID